MHLVQFSQNNMTQLTYAKAINSAIKIAMLKDEHVICYGLGADDPKGVFGTLSGLQQLFGDERVFDIPTSENAMTGVAIGASIGGYKTVLTHQRLDFALLSIDQIVNGAAKMHYMFNGEINVPLTIRMIIGRGWGQGPTHSQNLQAWFAHIPGLKVVMPASAFDAKGLLLSAIFDPNPVIFLEHRWLHNSMSSVPDEDYRIEIGKSKKLMDGDDITLVSMSYMTIEAIKASKYLKEKGINIDLIDLRSIKPLDLENILKSLSKTGRLLVLDTGAITCSVATDIIAKISINHFNLLKQNPSILAMPDYPEPTSYGLTKKFYKNAADVADRILSILDIKGIDPYCDMVMPNHHDVPGDWFQGPF